MALKAILANLDGLSENVAAEYTKSETDDKFYLQVDSVEGYALEDVAGLKNTLSGITKERSEARDRLKRFDGVDPKQAREDRARVVEMADWTPDEKVKQLMADANKQVTEKHEGELTAEREKSSKSRNQLGRLLVQGEAHAALAKQKMAKGGADLLMPHIVSQVALIANDDGDLVPRVVNPDGSERISLKPGSGATPMGIEELVETMKDGDAFYALAFAGSGASGSGAQTSGAPGAVPKDTSDMSPAEKIKAGLAATTPARKTTP